MSEQSTRLALPYLAPAQAQKHVTHNEALKRLDHIVQLVFVSVGAITPPGAPEAGDIHALAPDPVDAWTGQGGRLAVRDGNDWSFVTPKKGWCGCLRDTGEFLRWDGQDWRPIQVESRHLDGIGIGTDWDATNRLSVAADATLLSHIGAGHQIKINKASDAQTASLLFQSNWVGHAEIGLAGDRALSVKLSADGETWYEALRADPDVERIDLAPAGTVRMELADTALRVDVPIIGNAVMANLHDTGAGCLMPVGAFGLGSAAQSDHLTHYADVGAVTQFLSDQATSAPSDKPKPGRAHAGLHVAASPTRWMELMGEVAGGTDEARLSFRRNYDGTVSPWQLVFSQGNVLGTVSQTGNAPTGALIERGSNANGEYRRYACGWQVCRRTIELSDLQITLPNGPLYMSGPLDYNLPIAFLHDNNVHSCAEALFSSDYNIRTRTMSVAVRTGYSSAPWQGVRFHNAQPITSTGTLSRFSLIAEGRWY